MREIKFRAWDKEKKEFIQNNRDSNNRDGWNIGEFAITPNGVLRFFESTEGGMDTMDKDAILMQYTGLKDKNGVEIYEGDIVKGDWAIVDDIEFGTVEFYGGAFRFKPSGLPLAHGYYLEECEVIGNIYENPELLKEQA